MARQIAEVPALWAAYQERGCQRARERLIELHRPYVENTVHRLRIPPGIEADDLISEGLIGLVRAVDTWRPEKATLVSWVIFQVRQGVQEWLRREDWAPRSVRDRQRAGEPVEILRVVSLESLMDEDEEHGGGLWVLDRLADPSPGPEEQALARCEAAAIAAAVARLPAREREVVREYYWRETTHKTIGAALDCCESRVSQLRERALGRLRAALVEPDGRETPTMETETMRGAVNGGVNGRANGTTVEDRRGLPWTAAEDALLREEWRRSSRRALAERLGRGVGSVQMRGKQLGLVEAPAVASLPVNGAKDGAAPVEAPAWEPPEPLRAWQQPSLPVLRRHEDAELAVMGELCRLVGELDDRQRTRVLRWLADWWGLWK